MVNNNTSIYNNSQINNENFDKEPPFNDKIAKNILQNEENNNVKNDFTPIKNRKITTIHNNNNNMKNENEPLQGPQDIQTTDTKPKLKRLQKIKNTLNNDHSHLPSDIINGNYTSKELKTEFRILEKSSKKIFTPKKMKSKYSMAKGKNK